MTRQRVIGLAVSHAFAYNRNVLRAIANWAERHPDWSFVALNPEFGRDTCEALKHVDAAVVTISSTEARRKLPRRLPVVDIWDLVPHSAGLRVAHDNAAVAHMAARHFLERGLRSIGYVSQSQYLFSVERERALRSCIEAAGCELHVLDFTSARYDLAPMSFLRFPNTALGDWLLSLPRPTGVFTPCDVWGVEVLQMCRDIGLRVPEDISVLGVDDDDLCCQMARPPMSSIILATEAIGRRAAESIERQLEKRGKRDFPTEEVLFPPVGISVRRSTDVVAIGHPEVAAAIRFIRENSHRPIDVSDVLKEVPVSRRWLERRVVEAIGTTLAAEIRRTRIERAKRLLAQTDLSIGDVARHSGFTELRHMEHCFRKELGLTPSQFRRQAKGG